jgi:predicted component of type VI protein secretion system
MNVRLEVVEGPRTGTVVPVPGPRFLIGRDPRCQLRPHSQAVSTFHCAVLIDENQVRVQDLGSTNGTLVNERCLRRNETMRLRDGDRLQVARLIFAVRVVADPPAPAPLSQPSAVAGHGPGPHLEVEPAPPGTESAIFNWLTDAGTVAEIDHDHDHDHDSGPRDLSSRTLMLPSPGLDDEDAGPAPSESSSGADRFSYHRDDPHTGAACFGLSPLQFDGPESVRALHASLMAWSRAPASRPPRLVLDLDAVDDLPPSLYALLRDLDAQCRDQLGAVRLCHAPASVVNWLKTLRLDATIQRFNRLDDALAAPWD